MALPVIKTTKYNKDVTKEKDPRNFALNTDLRNVSIKKVIKTVIETPFPFVIPHGLNYCPFFIVLFEVLDLSSNSMGFAIFDPQEGLPYAWSGSWWVDNDAFYFKGSSSDDDGKIAYIIIFDSELS